MNRYDFVYLFDCKDANPNVDPDAGTSPAWIRKPGKASPPT